MLQYVSPEGGIAQPSPENEEAGQLYGEDTDDWQRMVILAGTAEDHELLDPMLAPDRLLYRLFHEEGVRAHHTIPLAGYCSCSAERVETLLKSFGADELTDMREADGRIAVTCEFWPIDLPLPPGRPRVALPPSVHPMDGRHLTGRRDAAMCTAGRFGAHDAATVGSKSHRPG